jgi:hypothetical protein
MPTRGPLQVTITPPRDIATPFLPSDGMDEDDLTTRVSSQLELDRSFELERELEENMARIAPEPVEEEEEVDPSDPHGIRLPLSDMRHLRGPGPIAKDIGRGLFMESYLQVVGGAADAAQNTLSALDSVGAWINDTVPITAGPFEAWRELVTMVGAEAIEAVTPGEPVTVTGGLVRGISQFLVGFIPTLKGVKAISGGTAATGLGRFAQVEAAAAPAAALVFDPHEQRLSNLIEQFPELSTPITRYLQASPEDSEAEGRFKNALEGLGLGMLMEGFIRGVRAIKANRVAKGVDPKRPMAEPEEMLARDHIGDPRDPALTVVAPDGTRRGLRSIPREDIDKAMADYLAGRIPADRLPFQMNWSRFSSSEDAERITGEVAQLFRRHIDEARRETIGDEQLRVLADRLGMSPEEMLARRPGGVWNAEEVLAARMILDSATDMLINVARAAQNSMDDALLFELRRMIEIQGGLQRQFQGAASEAGRAFRAFQLSPGSQERQLEQITEMLMTEGGSEQMRRVARAIAQVNDPRQLEKAVRGTLGKRMSDMVVEAWYFSLLSGPQTHAVNVMSSAMKTAYRIPERALAARIAQARGTESVEVGEATEMFFALTQSLPGAIKAAYRAFRDDIPSDLFGKVEGRREGAISAKGFGMDAPEGTVGEVISNAINSLGTIARMPTRAIMAEDEFFRYVGKNMQTHALAYRQAVQEGLEGDALARRVTELVDNPPRHFLEDAEAFSRGNTWTTPLDPRFGGKLQQLSNMPGWNIPMKMALPFIRTPANLLKDAASFTPLGMLAGSIRKEITAGSARGDMHLAQMAIGGALALTFADQVWKGNITGHGPVDKDMSDTWRRVKQPYSILGPDGVWYSYNRTDPFGLFLGAVASYAEIAGQLDEMERNELANAIAVATSRSVMSKTWMRGPNDMLDAFTRPDIYFASWFERQMGTFLVPTGAAQIARNIDPVWREVHDMIDVIKSRTPGYSKTLPARRNLWGDKIIMEGGLGPDIISPIYRFDGEYAPIDEWLLDNGVNIRMPERIRDGVELDPWQYDRFVRLAGNELKDSHGDGAFDMLSAIFAGEHRYSAAWDRATDGPIGGRAMMVQNIMSIFREQAFNQLLREDAELQERWRAVREEEARAMRETIMRPEGGRLR